MEINNNTIDSKAFIANLKSKEDNRIHVHIPEARQCLEGYLQHELGNELQWLPEYDKIVEWLTDNKGKGLLCMGNNGRGKTLLCSKAIPAILNFFMRKIVFLCDAVSMGSNIQSLHDYFILSIDDIGTETVTSTYGNKLFLLSDIADEAEKKGKMLLLTTNLSSKDLTTKYGERTIDRLRGLCKVVVFQGKSMR